MSAGPIKLLVSVRSVEEARIALMAGVDCIDVKEPARGAMGRADYEVIKDIASEVVGQTIVSAALGEYAADCDTLDSRIVDLPLRYLKWGFSGFTLDHDQVDGFACEVQQRPGCSGRIVPVAYADWQRCNAPEPIEIAELTGRWDVPLLLVDTGIKDGQSLLRHLDLAQLREIVNTCRRLGTGLALAGSLQWDDLAAIKSLRPDWIGVRGLVCEGGDRRKSLDPERIARLKAMLVEPA